MLPDVPYSGRLGGAALVSDASRRAARTRSAPHHRRDAVSAEPVSVAADTQEPQRRDPCGGLGPKTETKVCPRRPVYIGRRCRHARSGEPSSLNLGTSRGSETQEGMPHRRLNAAEEQFRIFKFLQRFKLE